MQRLPDAQTLDRIAYRTTIFAFPVFGFGVIFGAIWAEEAWGRYWGWDPKETVSFIAWVVYAAYLHARSTAGWRDKNNADRLAATVVYQPKRIAGSLDQLSVMLPDGAWHLAHQAQFTKDEDRVAVRHLALVNGVRRLTLDADIASAGTQKAALRIQAIDLAMLRPLMPWKQRIAGDLSAEITLSGTSNAPLIDANMRANGLMLESQKLGDMNATVDYRPSAAALAVILNQDQSHQLGLNGDIPVNLSWSHGFAATIGNNQKMRVYSAGIQLAPFAGIAPQTLKNAAGLLQADLELTGPPLHPAVNGTMTITGAGGDIVPIGIKISDFEVHLRALPNSIEIAELSAKAAALNSDLQFPPREGLMYAGIWRGLLSHGTLSDHGSHL